MLPIVFYKAMADDTRLNILLLLAGGNELCVCDLMTALNDSQPKISRHLALLRQTGILQDRRQGQWVYYQLHHALPNWTRQVLQQTLNAAPANVLAVLENQANKAANCCS
ncbi:metalloregulator ArsR/SmtB family transcription factor [Rheinheimera hassiensis]|uniref:metalloregulator ArsR/SmtB family transcription factor n=1 Tax=Rheinheimera hassiensis TaxID=1193627 RepID=UPI001F057ADC|nr:metalloregulator ArsR/SmtB family transcription factor [Rheinheimera hassiensis]